MKKHILAACCAATLGGSAEQTNTLHTARVIVTATRRAAPVRAVANNPSVITSTDLESGRYRSVPEALQKTAGVFISNIADNPSQAAVNLRGFGGDAPHGKTLVLLNGRKLNRPDMATINWAQIPMQAVKRIEVIRGPNSVLYGNHAVGGVINILTKEPTEIPRTTVSASMSSDEKFEQTLTTSGRFDGLGYVAGLGHQSGDGYRDRSAFDTLSGSLRLSGNINDRTRVYTEISSVKEQHQLPGSLTSAQVNQNRRQATNPADAARSETLNLQSGVETVAADDLIVSLDGGYSYKDIEADMASYFTPSYYNYTIGTYTLSPKLTFFAPLAGMNNELIAGVDLTKEKLNTEKFNDKARTVLNTDTDITIDTIGGYLTDTLSLTDRLLLNAGVRLEENRVDADHRGGFSPYSANDSVTEEAWQTSLTWLPTDQLKLFAGIDRTYRYPFVDEQAIYTGWGDGFNRDLDPETGINYETGAEYMPVTNLILQATLFRTDMKNEITWDWLTSRNINLDETTHRGLELSAVFTQKFFALHAYYTWLQSEFTKGANQGNEIPWVPQNQLDINLDLFLTDALTFSTHMSYIGSMLQSGDNANTGANRQSEYALIDLLLQYNLPTEQIDATLFAGIDNLFATEYNYLVSWGGYYPAPERTCKAGLSVTF